MSTTDPSAHASIDGDLREISEAGLAEIRARVATARLVTIAAVDRASVALDDLGESARAFVAEARARLDALAHDERDGTLPVRVARLEAVLSSYLEIVVEESTSQAAVAHRAASQCDRIVHAVEQIDAVALTARLLSVNAAIKAAAVERGGAFDVIAAQMGALTGRVGEVNRLAHALVDRLLAVLPAIERRAEDLRAAATSFAETLRATVTSLRTDGEALRAAIEQSVESGERRLRMIAAESARASSAMRFDRAFLGAVSALEREVESFGALVREPGREPRTVNGSGLAASSREAPSPTDLRTAREVT
jgi:hypothetical protein